jgi:hypothetical protein
MFYFFCFLFLIIVFALPVMGFLDGIKYKKNDNKFLDSARWLDGK